jgi:hypothetical protein
LHDVAQVVDEEVQSRAALGDGAEEAVDGSYDVTDDFADEAGDVVDGVD